MNCNTPINYANQSIETMMRKFDAAALPPVKRFHYHQGVFLSGVRQVAKLVDSDKANTYKNYIKAYVDACIADDGSLIQCDMGQFDDMEPGVHLFEIYDDTKDNRYKAILDTFMDAIRKYPRIPSGGFYHKDNLTGQMWLDGLYMAGPLCCMYGQKFNEPEWFDETYKQILLMRDMTKDSVTGLWYHAYDDTKKADWANPNTGCSPEFWGRSIGWVPMAILDDLQYIPDNYEHRQEIIDILTDLLKSIVKYQSPSGMWYQVVDKINDPKNWPENSCTCLFVAAICRAVAAGYLPQDYIKYAKKGYEAVINSLEFDGEDVLIGNVCIGTGVGDLHHYYNRPTSTNDLHGVGAFLLMCAYYECELRRGPKDMAKACEYEEASIKFAKFDSDTALTIGNALIEEAKRRNNKICLDITIAGRRLFHYSSDGNAASNDIMVERKKNTAMHTGHSSLWAHYMLKDFGLTIYEKWALDPNNYAEVGGAFPIRLVNCPTAIGTITCSGFNHEQDHGIIVDVCRALIATDRI